jgi:hypothetical protein
MSTHVAKPEHEVAYQELNELVKRHAGHLTPIEILAIAANMVGKIIAMQDQRTTTTDMAMEIVKANIEMGNQQVLAQLEQSQGRG